MGDIARAVEMLRIAAKYIRESDDCDRLVPYDGAECDGLCIADDCDFAADALSEQNKSETLAEPENRRPEMRTAPPKALESLTSELTPG